MVTEKQERTRFEQLEQFNRQILLERLIAVENTLRWSKDEVETLGRSRQLALDTATDKTTELEKLRKDFEAYKKSVAGRDADVARLEDALKGAGTIREDIAALAADRDHTAERNAQLHRDLDARGKIIEHEQARAAFWRMAYHDLLRSVKASVTARLPFDRTPETPKFTRRRPR